VKKAVPILISTGLFLSVFSASAIAEPLSVSVNGVSKIVKIKCRNITTRQNVNVLRPAGTTVDCEAAGLVVNSGDKIRVTIDADAQGMRPDAPANLVGTASSTSVFLRWQASAGAQTYQIYGASSPGATPSSQNLLGSTSSTLFFHNNVVLGNTYFYVITASNDYGESMISNEIAISIAANPFDHTITSDLSCAMNGCHDGSNAATKSANHPVTNNACEACHKPTAWLDLVLPFPHENTSDSCSNCHSNAIAAGKPAGHCDTTQECSDCHTTSNWFAFADCLGTPPPPPPPAPTPLPPPIGGGGGGVPGSGGGGGGTGGGGGGTTGGGGGGNTGGGGGGNTGGGGGGLI